MIFQSTDNPSGFTGQTIVSQDWPDDTFSMHEQEFYTDIMNHAVQVDGWCLRVLEKLEKNIGTFF